MIKRYEFRKGIKEMSKSILVIDMPKNCITCQFRFSKWNEEVGTFHICSICDERLREEDFGENRADFCPLKTLPERMKADYDTIATCEVTEKVVAIGWNACIDKILGE